MMRSSPRVILLAFGAVILVVGACCHLPSYTPAFWNDGGTVQSNNNCYNYGNNKRTDTFAQPGRASGSMATTMQCNPVRTGALADGLTALPASGNCPSSSGSEECKVALVIWPNFDYHWYRLDSNGMWSHKPGSTQATNRDNSDITISNPETANRGPYTNFCGYLCSCSSSTEGAGKENIN